MVSTWKTFVCCVLISCGLTTECSVDNGAAMDEVLGMLFSQSDPVRSTRSAAFERAVPDFSTFVPTQIRDLWGTPLWRDVIITGDSRAALAAAAARHWWMAAHQVATGFRATLVHTRSHSDPHGAGALPFFASRDSSHVAVLVCRAVGSGDINGNIVSFADPRPQAGVLPLPPWFGVQVAETWEARAGHAVVFPAFVRYYIPVNRDPDVTREFELFVFSVTEDSDAVATSAIVTGPPALTWHWATIVHCRALGLAPSVRTALALLIQAQARSEPSQIKSNRGGWQSQADFLTRGFQHPPIHALLLVLYDAIFDYLAHSATPPEFQFLRHKMTLELNIHTSWAGWSTELDYNVPHSHPGATISGVYYVDVAAMAGARLHFLDPRMSQNSDTSVVVPSDDLVVLFPSWLDHFVEPCTGNGTRSFVAFNVDVRARK